MGRANYCDRCGKRHWMTDPIYQRFNEDGTPKHEYCTCDGPNPTVDEVLASRRHGTRAAQAHPDRAQFHKA